QPSGGLEPPLEGRAPRAGAGVEPRLELAEMEQVVGGERREPGLEGVERDKVPGVDERLDARDAVGGEPVVEPHQARVQLQHLLAPGLVAAQHRAGDDVDVIVAGHHSAQWMSDAAERTARDLGTGRIERTRSRNGRMTSSTSSRGASIWTM